MNIAKCFGLRYNFIINLTSKDRLNIDNIKIYREMQFKNKNPPGFTTQELEIKQTSKAKKCSNRFAVVLCSISN
jgi:hypothetical protein